MNKSIDIKKIWSSIQGHFSKPNYDKAIISPEKDWLVIVYSFFGCLIIAGIWSVYINRGVEDGSLWTSQYDQVSISSVVVHQSDLKKMKDYFDQKSKTLLEWQNGGKIPADPSI